jgi:cytochrome b
MMWFSGSSGGEWLRLHIWSGEAVAVLLLFRLIWGVAGSQSARFSQFIKGPQAVRRYLAGDAELVAQPGHNPLGGWMVVLMLLVLLFQAGTGLFSSDVDSYLYNGPLAARIGDTWSETVTGVHKLNFDLLLLLVTLHVSAIAAYRVFKKQNLLLPMLTGRQTVEGEVAPLSFAPLRLALAGVLLSAGLVVALVLGLGSAG